MLTLLAIALAVGATIAVVQPTTVKPPAEPDDAVMVFLVDHGRTPSLVLPNDESLVAYVYGDWQYYALGRRGPGRMAAALFWPTTGTLGRLVLGRGENAADVHRLMPRPIDALYPIAVPRTHADQLTARLDREHQEGIDRGATGPGGDFVFIPFHRRYTGFGNSNHAVADWMTELGCEVRGFPFLSRWRMGSPVAGGAP